MLPLILAGAGAALDLIGQNEARRDNRQRVNDLRQSYMKSLYSPDEEARKLDTVSDTFNTTMADAMNQYGTSARGILNADTMRAVTMAKLVAQKAGALSSTQNQMDAYNRDMLAKANGVVDDTPPVDLGGVLGAGIQGYMLGDQIGRNQKVNKMLDAEIAKQNVPTADTTSKATNIVAQSTTKPSTFNVMDTLGQATVSYTDVPQESSALSLLPSVKKTVSAAKKKQTIPTVSQTVPVSQPEPNDLISRIQGKGRAWKKNPLFDSLNGSYVPFFNQ